MNEGGISISSFRGILFEVEDIIFRLLSEMDDFISIRGALSVIWIIISAISTLFLLRVAYVLTLSILRRIGLIETPPEISAPSDFGEIVKEIFFLKRSTSLKQEPPGEEVAEAVKQSNDNYKSKSEQRKRTILERDYLIEIEGGNFNWEPRLNIVKFFGSDKEVTLSDFALAKYPVTQRLYKKVTGENPSEFKGDNRPVDSVSWWEAIEFCNKLSRLEGLPVAYDLETGHLLTAEGELTINPSRAVGYRLPSEAEWFFAARGGNLSRDYKYSGSNNLDQVAWYAANTGVKFFLFGDGSTRDVAQKKPNELGIYDMSGNVWEWCQDARRHQTTKSERREFGVISLKDLSKIIPQKNFCLPYLSAKNTSPEEIAKLAKNGGNIKELDDEELFASKRGNSVLCGGSWRCIKLGCRLDALSSTVHNSLGKYDVFSFRIAISRP